MALQLAVNSPDPEGRTTRRYRFSRSQGPILLGRRGGCDILLPLDDVEPVHARIESHQHSFYLVDLNSQLGTQLNGTRVPSGRRLPLSEGDRIEIAGAVVDVRLDPDQLEELPDLGARVMRELCAILPAEEAHPRLEVSSAGSADRHSLLLELSDHTYVLGHQGEALALDEVDMWREQLAIERNEVDVQVRPMSNRPVLHNGVRLVAPTRLRDGDALRLGERVAIFRDPSALYQDRLAYSDGAPNDRANAPDDVSPILEWAPMLLAILGGVLGSAALAAIFWLLAAS